MDDFTLFERTSEIKNSICIICNDNDHMVQDWVVRLTDTDFPFSEVKSVDQLRELPGPERPEFIVLPHEHSGWEDAARERKNKHDRSLVVSIGGFAFFLAVERMNPGMPEKFSEKWNKEADELLLPGGMDEIIKKMKSINWYTGRVVFEYQPNPYGQSFGWFDTELKDHFGLDIFAEPFDREKGFGIYKKNNIEVFVYKLEKLNSLEVI